ncbi:unknown [Clostridium sp. CAG:921]|nr:unknown [Clostridium sp. CAG:921]
MMIIDEINYLKNKLEKQIAQNDSYERIYETSARIDKLLINYYNDIEASKRSLNC